MSIEMKLEAVAIPVADVDRAKRFYTGLGWRLDIDFVKGDAFRAVQFTPPGSACSIHIGKGITPAAPGSATGLFLVVSDIEAAHADLKARGAEVSDVFYTPGLGEAPITGRDPQRRSYSSFVTFKDPDGNSWLVQEITTRLPGRLDASETKYTSLTELASALRRAETAHGTHEKKLGHRDEDWPSWYAEYMVDEQAGKPLPT